MPRLQILELPEGVDDDRPPFVLVIDEYTAPQPDTSDVEAADSLTAQLENGFLEKIGARGVLIFPDTIDIPANQIPVDPDGHPLKLRIEGDFTTLRQQAEEEVMHAQSKITRRAPADTAGQDTDELTPEQTELLDALDMSHTRDWNDIRNAATALRRERDELAAEVERLHAGEEPATDSPALTPAQWIWTWNRLPAEKRIRHAADIQHATSQANACWMNQHDIKISELAERLGKLRSKHEFMNSLLAKHASCLT